MNPSVCTNELKRLFVTNRIKFFYDRAIAFCLLTLSAPLVAIDDYTKNHKHYDG